MLRAACLSAALLACAPALAQNYAGTYTAKNPSGGTLMLTLAHEDQKRVSGTLTGHGRSSLQVQARVEADGLRAARRALELLEQRGPVGHQPSGGCELHQVRSGCVSGHRFL